MKFNYTFLVFVALYCFSLNTKAQGDGPESHFKKPQKMWGLNVKYLNLSIFDYSKFWHCQNVSKSFGRGVLFKNLSLTILEGDKIGFIGLNGCGKSTFLKILAGLESLDSGTLAPKRGI